MPVEYFATYNLKSSGIARCAESSAKESPLTRVKDERRNGRKVRRYLRLQNFRNLLIEKDKFVAEREGFEPPSPCGLTVFKTAAFNRSATSPLRAKCSVCVPRR